MSESRELSSVDVLRHNGWEEYAVVAIIRDMSNMEIALDSLLHTTEVAPPAKGSNELRRLLVKMSDLYEEIERHVYTADHGPDGKDTP